MAVTPTLYSSGTQTATVTTEHFLDDINEAGLFTFHIDLVNMANGDILEIRIYQMILTSGASRVLFFHGYYGAQSADDSIKVSVPIGNDLTDATSLRFSIKQTFGTGRNFPWKILKY
jgi:hypothetical protein